MMDSNELLAVFATGKLNGVVIPTVDWADNYQLPEGEYTFFATPPGGFSKEMPTRINGALGKISGTTVPAWPGSNVLKREKYYENGIKLTRFQLTGNSLAFFHVTKREHKLKPAQSALKRVKREVLLGPQSFAQPEPTFSTIAPTQFVVSRGQHEMMKVSGEGLNASTGRLQLDTSNSTAACDNKKSASTITLYISNGVDGRQIIAEFDQPNDIAASTYILHLVICDKVYRFDTHPVAFIENSLIAQPLSPLQSTECDDMTLLENILFQDFIPPSLLETDEIHVPSLVAAAELGNTRMLALLASRHTTPFVNKDLKEEVIEDGVSLVELARRSGNLCTLLFAIVWEGVCMGKYEARTLEALKHYIMEASTISFSLMLDAIKGQDDIFEDANSNLSLEESIKDLARKAVLPQHNTPANAVNFEDLPRHVLDNITNRLPTFEHCWALACISKFFYRQQTVEKKAYIMQHLEQNYYSCYLLKKIVEDHLNAKTIPKDLRIFNNKSWLSLAMLAEKNMRIDEPPCDPIVLPKNEVEREGVNIKHEMNFIMHADLNVLVQKLIVERRDMMQEIKYACLTMTEMPDFIEVLIHKYYNFPSFYTSDEKTQLQLKLSVIIILRHIVDIVDNLSAAQLRMIYTFLLDTYSKELLAKNNVKALADNLARKVKSFFKPPVPVIVPVSKRVLDFDTTEIAQQLTMQQFETFSAVTPIELIKFDTDRDSKSPNLLRMVNQFNHISAWVASSIVEPLNLNERVQAFEALIYVAKSLVELHNFNAAMAFHAGFSNAAVARLKKTKSELSSQAQEFLSDISELMDGGMSYKNYRQHLTTASLPAIPYIGLFLTDMLFISEGNPTKTNIRNAVHFHKLNLQGKVLNELLTYQEVPYAFPKKPELANLISQELQARSGDMNKLDLNLHVLSSLREPFVHTKNK